MYFLTHKFLEIAYITLVAKFFLSKLLVREIIQGTQSMFIQTPKFKRISSNPCPLALYLLSLIVFLSYPLAAVAQTSSSYEIRGGGNVILNGQTSSDYTTVGSHDVNFGSAYTPFEIVNNSSSDLIFNPEKFIRFSAGSGVDFRIASSPSKTIPAGEKGEFTVIFDPLSPGLKTVTISISADNSFSQGHWFQIQGIGVGEPRLGFGHQSGRFTPNKQVVDPRDFIYFGDVTLESPAVVKNFYVKNFDSEPLIFTESMIELLGYGDQDFTLTRIPSSAIEEGQSDYFSISFSPIEAGDRAVTLFVSKGSSKVRVILIGDGSEEETDPETDPDPEPDPDPDSDSDPDPVIDTDKDGVSDAQELLDASDPTDASSYISRLNPDFCFDWNGFLGMSYNIAEFGNFTSHPVDISSSIYDTSLRFRDNKSLAILPGSQSDLLAHDMKGWSTDSVGTVCSRATSSSKKIEAGDIQGRMLRYKPNSDGSFDFVLSNEFSNPVTGSQYAQFNHFHPSYDPAETGFFVANWFSIRNFEETKQSGNIVVYDIDGSVLRIVPITLSPRGLYDFGTHIIGANKIGLVEWRPASNLARFRTNLSRYFYGAPFGVGVEKISDAVTLPGLQGTSKMLVSPVDTRDQDSILEISNTSANSANIQVIVNDKLGNNVLDVTLPVAPRASTHLLIDSYLNNDLGLVFVKNTFGGKVVANTIQYKRNSRAGLQNVFTISARESLGSNLLGTYNTFLNQDCYLTLSNSKASAEEVKLSLIKYNGQTLVHKQSFQVPGRGVLEINTCQFDTNNSYGTVRVETSRSGAITANMLRVGFNEDYRFATPVK